MPKRIAPLECSHALARRLGAQVIGTTPPDLSPHALADFRIGVVDRVNAADGVPVFAPHGVLLTWPIQPGARDTGAGR